MFVRPPSNPLLLIGPSILLVFAASFFVAWTFDRARRHLLLFGAAGILFCLGTLSQVLWVPPDAGLNAVVSAFIYTASVLVFREGLLMRCGLRTPLWADLAAAILIVGGIAYFYYVDCNLLVRVYILQFGYGAICFWTAWRVRILRLGRLTERILFWTLLVFSIQFVLRTVLTAQFIVPGTAAFGQSLFWLVLQLSLAVLGVALALAVLGVAMGDVIDDLRRDRSSDSLTGLLNRRGFEEGAAQLMRDRHPWPISIVVADIDHFKQINDLLGHAVGDEVLRAIGAILRQQVGRRDLCGRLGGEEFVLLLPGRDEAGAVMLAERLRQAIGLARFAGVPESWQITASFGLVEGRRGKTLSEWISRADAALYNAKRSGRDRVERSTGTAGTSSGLSASGDTAPSSS